jgi:uncharacterized membrane protein YhaH (DUF805 family)
MSFGEAVSSGFHNYVTFGGRAVRSEYWYWQLFTVLVAIVASVSDAVLGAASMIYGLTTLALLLPGLAVSVRRFHDSSKNGWNLLWFFVPVLGWLYLLYLVVRRGTPGPNNYGPEAG